MSASIVQLEFKHNLINPEEEKKKKQKFVNDGLSAILQTGPCLWLGSDETRRLERLTTKDGGATYADHTRFSLSELVDLPGSDSHECDIEGLAFDSGYLWVIGSHSPKRKKPKGKKTKKDIERLAKIEIEDNRYLIARIPLRRTDDGAYEPFESDESPAGQVATTEDV